MPQFIFTAVGPDKPGLVGALTGHLHAGGANIVDSRMVNLRGEFAVIVLAEGAAEDLARLQGSLPGFAATLGLQVTLAPQAAAKVAVRGVPFKLKTYSLDQPGLVHRITEVLRAAKVNIEELTARQETAPFEGTVLFVMEMRLTVPADLPVRQLRAELQAAAEKLNCDLDLEPA